MSEQIRYIEAFEMFAFDPDVNRCRCRGSGWALSDLDSWHRCHYHYTNQRHPEDDGTPHCIECMDGENYPPDQCPKCGPALREELAKGWQDMPSPPEIDDDEESLDHECPF